MKKNSKIYIIIAAVFVIISILFVVFASCYTKNNNDKNTKESLCETFDLEEVTNSTELIKATEPTEIAENLEATDVTVPEVLENSNVDELADNNDSSKDIVEEDYPEEVQWYSSHRVTSLNTKTTSVCGEEIDRDFLAKLLYREGGAMNWWGQVYTCSAILNLCEVLNRPLSDCGRDVNCFAAAPYIDSATPTQMCYDVVDYVLNGGRIMDIAYFRTGYYHNFGTPVCYVDGHYFSKQ